jgi:hypothetical protein
MTRTTRNAFRHTIAWVHRIFTDCFDGIIYWQIAGNIRPRFSAIGCARDHRPIVTQPVGTRGNVSDIRILRARLDSNNPLTTQRLR